MIKKEDENNFENQNIEDSDSDIELEKDPEFGEISKKDVIAKLRERLKKSEEDKREYLLGWQKTKADYVNARRQDDESNKLLLEFAEVGLVTDLIPVLDSFEVALGRQNSDSELPPEWKKGTEQIFNQILNVLRGRGLEEINPLNDVFDPKDSEAIGMVAVTDPEKDGKIVNVFQKGYRIKGRVIRPAKVQVGKIA